MSTGSSGDVIFKVMRETWLFVPTDIELLHFEAALVLDHLVEDGIENLRVDQVSLGTDDFAG